MRGGNKMGLWLRKFKGGIRRYQIEWKDEEGKRCRETLPTNDKKIALQELAQRRDDVLERKRLGNPKAERILFEDFCNKEYLPWSKKGKRSWKRDDGMIKNLLTHFEGKYLDQINPYLIEKYRMERVKKVEKSTINRETACLKAIFFKAIEWDKFKGSNPVLKVKAYPESERIRKLEESEMSKFYETLYLRDKNNNFVIAPVIRNICLFALNTGCRRQEILSLKWTDINWKDKTVKITFTKNNRIKIINMNEQVEQVLRSIVQYDDCEYVFYHTWQGKRKRYTDIKRPWNKILKISGITDLKFHDLRHTAGSYLYKVTGNLITVQELLGHKDIRSTQRYVHGYDKDKEQAVSRLSLVYPKLKISSEVYRREKSQKLAENDSNEQNATIEEKLVSKRT